MKHPEIKKKATDQGRQFLCIKCKELMEEYRTRHIITCAYNSAANSMIERENKTLEIF